jgi:hypothetical protein
MKAVVMTVFFTWNGHVEHDCSVTYWSFLKCQDGSLRVTIPHPKIENGLEGINLNQEYNRVLVVQ